MTEKSTKKKKLNLSLLANESLVRDFSLALKTPPTVLRNLAKYVNTDNGIEIEDQDELLTIWEGSDLTAQDLSNVYSVLKYFFDQAFDKEISVKDLMDELKEFCADRDIDGFDERTTALRTFFKPSKRYIEKTKIIPYATGVIPNLYAVSAVVQLRAAYKNKNSSDIVGFAPVVQMRLTTQHASSEAEDHFVFQMGEHGVKELSRKLDELQKQLESMNSMLEDKVEIYHPDEDLK